MRLKIRIDKINSQHIHVTIFSDPSFTNDGIFANLGHLVMNHEEYHKIGCALGLGSEQMKGRFILMPGDPKFMERAKKEAEKYYE